MTVKELEEVGVEVRVSHYRPAPALFPRAYVTRHQLNVLGAKGSAFAPKGGITVATITLPTGETFAGIARCNPIDPFCYATGRELALDRAFEEAETLYKAGKILA